MFATSLLDPSLINVVPTGTTFVSLECTVLEYVDFACMSLVPLCTYAYPIEIVRHWWNHFSCLVHTTAVGSCMTC